MMARAARAVLWYCGQVLLRVVLMGFGARLKRRGPVGRRRGR